MHGTNDADAADDGQRWWQRGSNFTQHLVHRLAERGVPHVQIKPFHWTGKNSDYDRLKGSERLARLLRDLNRAGRPHAVIAHSHGGNVRRCITNLDVMSKRLSDALHHNACAR